MPKKRIITLVDSPGNHAGFLGPGHTARSVIERNFTDSDPFILLMDDVLDLKPDKPVGGPHPHAGFETVTLMLEGEIGDGIHTLKKGDFQLMTAGSGIIHSETISYHTRVRTLQLWLNLPVKYRSVPPRLQDLPNDNVPLLYKDGVLIKLYSGEFSGLASPIYNYTPLIVADITLEAGVTSKQQVPANFNTFIYIIAGALKMGGSERPLTEGQVAWLNLSDEDDLSEALFITGDTAARFILYAAKPTHESIITSGPFIADTPEDIKRLYREYRQGQFKHISTIPSGQRLRF